MKAYKSMPKSSLRYLNLLGVPKLFLLNMTQEYPRWPCHVHRTVAYWRRLHPFPVFPASSHIHHPGRDAMIEACESTHVAWSPLQTQLFFHQVASTKAVRAFHTFSDWILRILWNFESHWLFKALVALGFVFLLFEASCMKHNKNRQVLISKTNGALLGFGNTSKPSFSSLMKCGRQPKMDFRISTLKL